MQHVFLEVRLLPNEAGMVFEDGVGTSRSCLCSAGRETDSEAPAGELKTPKP